MVIKTQQNGAVAVVQTEGYCEKPYQAGQIFYNGLQQEPTWQNYDPSKMTVKAVKTTIVLDDDTEVECTKALTASAAGYYGVQFTLKKNYKWSDGTTAAHVTYWQIQDARQTANDVRLTNIENELIKAEKDILKLNVATNANVVQKAANYVMNDDFSTNDEVMLVQYTVAAATGKSTSAYYGTSGDSIKTAAVTANSGYIAVIPGEYWWITDQVTAEQFQVKAIEGNYTGFIVSSTVPLSKSYPSGSVITRTTITKQSDNTFKFIVGSEIAKEKSSWARVYTTLLTQAPSEYTLNISKNSQPVVISYYTVNAEYFEPNDEGTDPPNNRGLVKGYVRQGMHVVKQDSTSNYSPYITVSIQPTNGGTWSDYMTLQESIGQSAYQVKLKYAMTTNNVTVKSFPNNVTSEEDRIAYLQTNGKATVHSIAVYRSTGSLSANADYGEILFKPRNYALPLGALQLYVEHDVSYDSVPIKAFICYEPAQKHRELHKLYIAKSGDNRWFLGELSPTKGTRSVTLPDRTTSKVILDKNIDYTTLKVYKSGSATTVWRLQHPNPAKFSDTNVPNLFNLSTSITENITASYDYGQQLEEWFEMQHDFTDVFTQDSNGNPLSQLSKFIFNIPKNEQGQFNKLKLQLSRSTISMVVEGEVPSYPYTIQCTSALLRNAGFETSTEGVPVNATISRTWTFLRKQNTDGESPFYQELWRVSGVNSGGYVCVDDVLACTSKAQIASLQRYNASSYYKHSFVKEIQFSEDTYYDSTTNTLKLSAPSNYSHTGIHFRVIPTSSAEAYYVATAAERKLIPTQWCALNDNNALCPKALLDSEGNPPVETISDFDTTFVTFTLKWYTDTAIRSIKYSWTSQAK